ncbi:MAG: hypothetical protein NC337_14800 [Roseburia sp.]|nr:hypothetical protein [Roseburia sp.]
MAKLIITVEGGKITQTLNFLDRNIKDNRYVYGNGNESGIVDDPQKIFEDLPENHRITESYDELLEAVNLGKAQITDIMRRLNELEKEMNMYEIPSPNNEQEHVITLDNRDLKALLGKRDMSSSVSDKQIEEAIKLLIYSRDT